MWDFAPIHFEQGFPASSCTSVPAKSNLRVGTRNSGARGGMGRGIGKNQGPPPLLHAVDEASVRKRLHPNLRTKIVLGVGFKKCSDNEEILGVHRPRSKA